MTALCLTTPFTLAPAIAVPLTRSAAQESNQLSRYSQSLPLGQLNLPESRESTQLAPGLTHTVIVRGMQSHRDGYVVDVAVLATLKATQTLVQGLVSKGYQPLVKTIARPPDDSRLGPLGYLVRVGFFASNAGATNLQDQLVMDGYSGLRVVYTGEDGQKTTGPWVVNVLELDSAQFQGKLAPALATGIVPGLKPLTSIAARTNALAAVNGGYFVIESTNGTPGASAGISVIDGALVREAVSGRTSLILPSSSVKDARIEALTSQETVAATDGATHVVSGLNRKPGLIRACGGVAGEVATVLGETIPYTEPKHDFTCTNPSELLEFTPAFGQTSETAAGAEVVLDSSGQVIEQRNQCGGQIPDNGLVLCGTGDAVEWLSEHAQLGTRIDTSTNVLADGKPLPLTAPLGVINGGPRLLRDGVPDITAEAEGFDWPEDPGFYYRFGIRRNPRTLAGITSDGKLLLVTVDGRQPGYSVGASFKESAKIMRSLGAVNAVNLDGGGSTTIVVKGKLLNRPSDTTGERPIGNAIIIQP